MTMVRFCAMAEPTMPITGMTAASVGFTRQPLGLLFAF